MQQTLRDDKKVYISQHNKNTICYYIIVQQTKFILYVEMQRKLKSAIDEGKSIPTEIVAEARGLLHELEADVLPISADKDDIQAIDDEYANIGT